MLYALARWYSAQGQRVLVSTTTHIQRPDANYAPDEAARDALWQAGTYAVAGVPAEGGKLTMPPYLDDWMAEADTVLQWGNHCKTSASALKRPAPCWLCRPRRP